MIWMLRAMVWMLGALLWMVGAMVLMIGATFHVEPYWTRSGNPSRCPLAK